MSIIRSLRNWPSQPAYDAATVTPDDSTDLARTANAFYVGTTGDLKLRTLQGTDVVFKTVPVGIFPVGAQRVFSTGTSASNIVALYN